MFERVVTKEGAAFETLAWKVRNELAAAGLPVVWPGADPALVAGAEVDVDYGADAAGGVFVAWQASPRLQACSSRAFRLKQLDEPVLRHSHAVGAAMMQAMASVLASAGYSVEDARDDYRPQQLRVLAGPPSGRSRVWQLRDDELDAPGWREAPADSADRGTPPE
ncbi:hypothetical protein [Actinacidiphila acidipaludis]|uniref:Uncharacterized protein n=1 Tax=Actinacidiphila acidipaludis TaxID=2873382 RepID=A0ABS7PZX9_9ACTN|nr:hypothetical protein [Streptomyces acidipaludis]MBY8876211.1 hypothetical protein [Streptomyces acidipaludis]